MSMSLPDLKNIKLFDTHVILDKYDSKKEGLECIDNRALQWIAKKLGKAVSVNYNGVKHTVLKSSLERFVTNNGDKNFHVKGLSKADIDKAIAKAMANLPIRIVEAKVDISDTAKNVFKMMQDLEKCGVKVDKKIMDDLKTQSEKNPNHRYKITGDFVDSKVTVTNVTKKLYEQFEGLGIKPTAEERARFLGAKPTEKQEKTSGERQTEALLGEHKAPASTAGVEAIKERINALSRAQPREVHEGVFRRDRGAVEEMYRDVSATVGKKAGKLEAKARAEQHVADVKERTVAAKQAMVDSLDQLFEALENTSIDSKKLSRFRNSMEGLDLATATPRQIGRHFADIDSFITKAWTKIGQEIPQDIAEKINDFNTQIGQLIELIDERKQAAQEKGAADKALKKKG